MPLTVSQIRQQLNEENDWLLTDRLIIDIMQICKISKNKSNSIIDAIEHLCGKNIVDDPTAKDRIKAYVKARNGTVLGEPVTQEAVKAFYEHLEIAKARERAAHMTQKIASVSTGEIPTVAKRLEKPCRPVGYKRYTSSAEYGE